jgi:hypothetical protein
MSTPEGDDERTQGQQGGQAAPRDLIDFYRRWLEFRQVVTRLADRDDLSASERQTIHWLILLADRISEHDLQPLKRP